LRANKKYFTLKKHTRHNLELLMTESQRKRKEGKKERKSERKKEGRKERKKEKRKKEAQ